MPPSTPHNASYEERDTPATATDRAATYIRVVLAIALPILLAAGAGIGTIADGVDDPVRVGLTIGFFVWVGTIGLGLAISDRG